MAWLELHVPDAIRAGADVVAQRHQKLRVVRLAVALHVEVCSLEDHGLRSWL